MQQSRENLALNWVIVAIVTTIWTVILPGAVAYVSGTFYPADSLDKLSNDGVKAEIAKSLTKRDELESALATAEQKVLQQPPTPTGIGEIESLIKHRDDLRNELANYRSRIRVSGFIDNETTLVWWLTYFCLFSLVLFYRPSFSTRLSKKTFVVAIVAFGALQWVNWLRNTSIGQYRRTVYAYVHIDLSIPNFLLQEARLLGMFILLSIVWHSCIRNSDDQTSDTETTVPEPDNLALVAIELEDAFQQWQRNSIFLAGAFLPWTWFYWRSLSSLGDPRYIFSAVILHLLWLFTWIAVTVKVWEKFKLWTRWRTLLLAKLSMQGEHGDLVNRKMSFIKDLDPLPTFQVVSAATIALASFLLPLLEKLR